VPGNHEYEPFNEEEDRRDIEHLSVQWKPQFALPENGPEGMEETVYYLDYQGVRIIGLNSSEKQAEQAEWLEKVLADNPNRWTVVTYHHPLFSASAGRDNEKLRALWKPLFDQYQVDIALQGHDHSYARGSASSEEENVVDGLNTRKESGTVYVVSVSGGKMYELKPEAWENYEIDRDRAAENTQLFQVIRVVGDTLSFEAYTATGKLYDAFDLVKSADGGPNLLIDRSGDAIAARRHDNTISYQDELPEHIRADILSRYPDYAFDKIRYVDRPDFTGYLLELEKGEAEINLKIAADGKVLEERMSE
jgi:hypothetical protein